MTESGCLIVGGSHAAAQLSLALRKNGYDAPICIIGEEPVLPYHRPPLSKDFLTGGKSLEQIQLRPASAYEKAEVEFRLATRVEKINREQRTVNLDNGEQLAYSHLVLATGARARALPVPGAELAGVCYLRDASDIEKIRAASGAGGRAVVIGGGYIGLEAAATLKKLGMKVTVVEAADRVLQRVTSPVISQFYERLHTEEGVDVLCATGVEAIVGETSVSGVALGNGEVLEAQLVVIGIGVVPNSELAADAGLEVNNGIVVNHFGCTSDPAIFACGDCANGYHGFYQQQLRLESVQNANDQALTVARAICGQPTPYEALPWFWSDQFDVKLQIAGLAAGYDDLVVRGDSTSGRKFSVFYLRGDQLLSVDALNSPKEFIGSKKLIFERTSVDKKKLADPEIGMADCVG